VSVPPGIELVAFDLDNTLYDEGLWYDAALPPIAAHLAARSGHSAGKIERFLRATLRAHGRHYHHLFDDTLSDLGLPREPHLREVLAIFRDAPASLELFPGMRELLTDLAARYRLGLITSGQPLVQERKVELLGIRRLFAAVILSSTLPENKPGRMPFERLLEAAGVPATRAAYVGDNPLFDFRGANEVGMLTIRVPNPELDATVVPDGWDARLRVTGPAQLRSLLLSRAGY
jgi:putative hydrolase of the HAD superfamily